jgi:hypothetical protein
MDANTAEQKEKQQSTASQISELYSLSTKELKERYKIIWPDETPASNKEYLIRKLAYKLQEDIFGTLSPIANARIDTLKTELNPINELGKRSSGKKHKANKLPLPGTVITKDYKGLNISVKVLSKGFEYNGKEYKSLSGVAKVITGVHQSGFIFFGL